MATIETRADLFKETDYFSIFQPNQTERNKSTKGDCVIRAFAIAADLTWLQAFDQLVTTARATYNVPNDKACYDRTFKRFGFERMKQPLFNGHRQTVEGFCKAHPKGRYILRLAHHLTAVVDGVCYDTWNPANYCIYFYYELKTCKK